MPMVLLVQSVMAVCFYRFSSYSFTIFSFSFCFVSHFCLLLVVGSLLCCLALLFHPIARHQSGGESRGCFFFSFFFVVVVVPPAVFNLSLCAVWSWCCFAPSCVFVRGGGVRSLGEFGVLVHPSLGLSVKFVCVVLC